MMGFSVRISGEHSEDQIKWKIRETTAVTRKVEESNPIRLRLCGLLLPDYSAPSGDPAQFQGSAPVPRARGNKVGEENSENR
ncbi:Hypothetical protein NTJ_12610 [Nesidiocoris tenuis]|uniref:Uncharacterized protein n=1 Tax=Nesidiocoris tenuis TaxID=355587 RepID=A0ABN7B826_9HEMI|nr:Hypothetical protein NTJ_12610 [Nesidiocoris tenuis]